MAKVFKRKWKNKNGEGSTWAFTYSDTFGKRKIESGFETKIEAEKALSKKIQEIENGFYVDSNKKSIVHLSFIGTKYFDFIEV